MPLVREMGSLHEITAHAEAAGLEVVHVALDGQFRCGGSQAYLDWVPRLLGLRHSPDGGGPVPWTGDELSPFQVRVAETPEEMETLLATQMQGGIGAPGCGARMSAGYCWPWSDPVDGQLVPDVRIGGWANRERLHARGGQTSQWL